MAMSRGNSSLANLYDEGRNIASLMADNMGDILFAQEPSIERHANERYLRRQAQSFIGYIAETIRRNKGVDEATEEKLKTFDQWLHTKLSGSNILHLAKEIESTSPEMIPLLPLTLGARFEELRIARLWASLLNPESLRRLSSAIEAEIESMNHEGY